MFIRILFLSSYFISYIYIYSKVFFIIKPELCLVIANKAILKKEKKKIEKKKIERKKKLREIIERKKIEKMTKKKLRILLHHLL